MNNKSDLLQNLAFIIGLVTASIALIKEITKIVGAISNRDVVDARWSRMGRLSSLVEGRSILDLSFVFLCAAFFSLLLSDSLIISGRAASNAVDSIIFVFFYSTLVVATMLAAWVFNQSEKVIGLWAITTLIVLIIAPGGPFNRAVTGTEAGLSVYIAIPVIILLLLASSMFIYSFGNPLSKNVKRKFRAMVSLILAVLIVVASVAVGTQIDNYVDKDLRSPDFKNPQAKELTREVLRLSGTEDKRLYYQLASEVNLANFYQNSFFKAFSQPTDSTASEGGSQSEKESTSLPAPSLRSDTTSNLNKNVRSPMTNGPSRVSTSSSNASVSNPAIVNAPGCEEMLQDFGSDLPYSVRSRADFSKYIDDYVDKNCNKIDKRLQIAPKLNYAVNLFEGANTDQTRVFLLDRILWIHPAGLRGADEAVIPLPHRIAEERLKILSEYRMITILRDDDKQRDNLLKVFTYPRNVREFYGNTDIQTIASVQASYFADKESERKANLYSQLYRRFQDHEGLDPQNLRLLKEQLSMPLEEESAVAFKQYQVFARQHIKSKLPLNKTDGWLITMLGNARNFKAEPGLDEKSLRALNYYVARAENLEPIAGSNVPIPTIAEVLRMLSEFKEKGIDFSQFISSADPTKVGLMMSCLGNPVLNIDPNLKAICDGIRDKVPVTQRGTFLTLLANNDSSVPIDHLLRGDILSLGDELNDSLDDAQKASFISATTDPVWYSALQLSQKPDSIEDGVISPLLRRFRALAPEDREAVLHQLAVTLYKPGGPNSLNPISSMIAQFRFWNDNAGWICAAILCLPFLLAVTILGGYFARILVSRDRLREVIESESSEYANLRNTLGTPVDNVFGREDVLQKLRSLAERGWSTIGVIGRRGVGKSRVLHTLSTGGLPTGNEGGNVASIRVWISAPSKFSENEFVVSILERLAASTEEVIAKFLGAKPLATRTIESKISASSAWVFGAALVIFGIVVFLMFERLSRWDIAVIWVPVLALLFASLCLFAHHISKTQPVNLTAWLQRERNENPHTYLLYREVYQVLTSLKQNKSGPPLVNLKPFVSTFRLIILNLLTVVGLICLLWFLFLIVADPPIYDIGIVGGGIVFLIVLGLWLYFFQKNDKTDDAAGSSQSLMSLVVDFRTFASTVIYRLNRGALNYKPEEKFAVMICIDELDKIVDFEEIRSFIRRIKAIFEVPGLYYYISIAEDTLQSLYLGSAMGKNEIDSSFDHIVRIPPLSCGESQEVAGEYIGKSVSASRLSSRQTRLIATISFGIPRDVIRRCDEFLSASRPIIDDASGPQIPLFRIELTMRKTQLALGYELKKLTSRQVISFETSAEACAKEALDLAEAQGSDDFTLRIILSIWLLALIEIAVDRLDDVAWEAKSENFCELGYKISELPVQDLIDEIRPHHELLVITEATDRTLVGVSKDR